MMAGLRCGINILLSEELEWERDDRELERDRRPWSGIRFEGTGEGTEGTGTGSVGTGSVGSGVVTGTGVEAESKSRAGSDMRSVSSIIKNEDVGEAGLERVTASTFVAFVLDRVIGSVSGM
jgi:hypothetical protein